MRIEIFSCAGGMAEGFRRAGVVFDFAFDFAPDHCDSYEANLGHRPIGMDVRDLLRMARGGFGVGGGVELVVADPPCTPWSRAGKRLGQEDDRDMLAVTVELLDLLRPNAWLIGNVPGLDDAENWRKVVQPVVGGFAQRAGYCVDFARLDAADYGVPQHRVRPFWFGHRVGTACARWPAPTHGAPGGPTLPGVPALLPWVTCADALGHLEGDDLGRPVKLRWRDDADHRPSEPSEPSKTLTRNRHGDGALLVNRRHPPASPASPAPTLGAKVRRQSAEVLAWPWPRPATVVMSDPRIPAPDQHKEGSFLSQPGTVLLSERAAAILQGFPDGWRFAGATKRARWSQLGQAMPPALAEAVARAVVEQMAKARERAA